MTTYFMVHVRVVCAPIKTHFVSHKKPCVCPPHPLVLLVGRMGGWRGRCRRGGKGAGHSSDFYMHRMGMTYVHRITWGGWWGFNIKLCPVQSLSYGKWDETMTTGGKEGGYKTRVRYRYCNVIKCGQKSVDEEMGRKLKEACLPG